MSKPTARELLEWIHRVHTETGCTCAKHSLPCDAENLAIRVEKMLPLTRRPLPKSWTLQQEWGWTQAMKAVRRVLDGENP